MPYNDANEFAILGGAPARDILDSTPGFAGPLQSGSNALQKQSATLKDFLFNPKVADNVLTGGKLQEAAQAAKGPSGVEKFLTRGVYLLVGSILLVFGLVMLSRPVREGVAEGAVEGLREAWNERA